MQSSIKIGMTLKQFWLDIWLDHWFQAAACGYRTWIFPDSFWGLWHTGEAGLRRNNKGSQSLGSQEWNESLRTQYLRKQQQQQDNNYSSLRFGFFLFPLCIICLNYNVLYPKDSSRYLLTSTCWHHRNILDKRSWGLVYVTRVQRFAFGMVFFSFPWTEGKYKKDSSYITIEFVNICSRRAACSQKIVYCKEKLQILTLMWKTSPVPVSPSLRQIPGMKGTLLRWVGVI